MTFKSIDVPREDKFPCLNGLRLIGMNIIVLWYQKKAHFFHLNVLLTKLCSAIIPTHIVDIIAVHDRIYFLAEDGLVYKSTLKESIHLKPGKSLECKEIPCAKDTLHIYSSSNELVIIKKFGEICILKQNSADEISDVTISFSLPWRDSHEFRQTECHMVILNSSDFHPIFASLLFRKTALMKCEILFITIGNGCVLWIPLLSTVKDYAFRSLYNAVSPVYGIVASGGGKSKLYDRIMLLSSDGSINVIQCDIPSKLLKYNRLYLPSNLKSFCFSEDYVFHSDGINFWQNRIICTKDRKLSLNSQLLHIKGVVSLESGGNSQQVIVGCKHALLYILDYSKLALDVNEDQLISRVHRSTEYDGTALLAKMELASLDMLALRESLLIENKLLREISVAARTDLLKNFLEFKVEVIEDSAYDMVKFVLKVSNKSQQEFSNELWSIYLSFSCGSWNLCSMNKLSSPLKPGNTSAFCLPSRIPLVQFPLIVNSSLVLVYPAFAIKGNEDKKLKLLEIPLERQFLGIEYFLYPTGNQVMTYIEDAEISKKQACEIYIKKFNPSISKNYPPCLLNQKTSVCYTFRLTAVMSWESFVKELLRKSQHKFQDSFQSLSELKVQVLHSIVTFLYNCENHTVRVLLSDMDIFYHIKDFILKTVLVGPETLSDIVNVCLEEDDLAKITNLSTLVDYYGNMDLKYLRSIKTQLRDFTSNRLPL